MFGHSLCANTFGQTQWIGGGRAANSLVMTVRFAHAVPGLGRRLPYCRCRFFLSRTDPAHQLRLSPAERTPCPHLRKLTHILSTHADRMYAMFSRFVDGFCSFRTPEHRPVLQARPARSQIHLAHTPQSKSVRLLPGDPWMYASSDGQRSDFWKCDLDNPAACSFFCTYAPHSPLRRSRIFYVSICQLCVLNLIS
jgi:hypothetical protein